MRGGGKECRTEGIFDLVQMNIQGLHVWPREILTSLFGITLLDQENPLQNSILCGTL
jgi:hypothetical protein